VTTWLLIIQLATGTVSIPDLHSEADCRAVAQAIKAVKPDANFVCIGSMKVLI
jgi:hypothetical protein